MRKTFSGKIKNIRKTCLAAESLFKSWHIPELDLEALVLSIDEALTNITTHGYSNADVVDRKISISIFKNMEIVIIIIKDNAKPYTIDSIPVPDKLTYLDSNLIGGFGVSIIKKLMDSVNLFRINDKNILWLEKNILQFTRDD